MADRRQNEKKLITRLQHGFTMAELLIVVAIIGILAAFGFVSVYQYQKNLHLTELDDTAKEIYVAAQNHLTAAKVSGVWDDFYQTDETGTDGNIIQVSNNKLNAEYGSPMGTQPKDYKKSDFNSKKYHDFRYFVVGDQNKKALQDIILPQSAIDGTIMPSSENDTHSIVIEYDAKTAVIYGVWYTDGKNGWFGSATHYNFKDDDRKEGRPADKNDASAKTYRRDHKPQLGYYGGGTRKEVKGKVTNPDVEIVNADRLYLRVKREKDENSSSDNTPSLLVQVKGDTSKKTADLKSVNEKKPDFYEDEDKKQVSASNSNKVYDCYIIDSVTDGKSKHFAEIFGNNAGFTPGENLTITVYKVRGTNVKYRTLHTNSLFASITGNATGTNMYTANLKYGRHLQNLSRDVSKLKWEGIDQAQLLNDIDWNEFYLDQNVHVNRNEKKGSEYRYSISLANPEELDDDHKDKDDTKSYAFYSIYNSNLTKFSGNNKTIRNLYMQQEYHTKDVDVRFGYQGVGLFGYVQMNLDIRDLKMVNPSFENDENILNAGVLVGIRNNLSNPLSLENVYVTSDETHPLEVNASETVGALAGRVRLGGLTIKDTHVNLKSGGSLKVTNGWAGGFIGLARDCSVINIQDSDFTNSHDLVIKASGNEDNLSYPAGSSGGLIGCIGNEYGGTVLSQMQVEDVFVRGIDGSITVEGSSYAGGLAGFMLEAGERIPGSGHRVISNVHYDGGEKGLITVHNETSMTGPRATGGFIGSLYSTGLTISKCSATTYVSVNAISKTDISAGGFIGDFRAVDTGSSLTTIDHCYYGGRVDDQGNYVSEPAFDTNNAFHKGGYNVADFSEQGDRVSGGFIGRISRHNGHSNKINIQNCYATGSVYIASLDQRPYYKTGVGGFIGLVTDNDGQDLQQIIDNTPVASMSETYATGKVVCGNTNGSNHIGTYIGTTGAYSIDKSSQNNYWLAGINEDMYGVGGNPWNNKNDNGSISQVEKTEPAEDGHLIFGEASLNQPGTPFAVDDNQKVNARPYSEALKNQKYPYASVTNEEIDKVSYGHVGDWPTPSPKATLRIDNGNTLAAIVGLNKSSFDGTNDLYVSTGIKGDGTGTGSASSKESPAYFVVHVTRAGDTYSANVISQNDAGVTGNDFTYTTGVPVQMLEADQVNQTHPWSYRNGNSDVNVLADNNDIYLEITLDDVRTNGHTFHQLFRQLTPGENITVYAGVGKKSWDELSGKAVADKQNLYTQTEIQKNISDNQITDTGLLRGSLAGVSATVNSLFADGSVTNSYDPSSFNLKAQTIAGDAAVTQVSQYNEYKDSAVVSASDNTSLKGNNKGKYYLTGVPASDKLKNTGIAYKNTALILNGRHLQNLSNYVSGVNADTSGGISITNAKVCDDILWNGSAFDGENLFSGNTDDMTQINEAVKTMGESTVNADGVRTDLTAFSDGSLKFRSIVNNQLNDFDGQGHSIYNLSISNVGIKGDKWNESGLIARAYADSFVMSDLNMVNTGLSNGGETGGRAVLIGAVGKDSQTDNNTKAVIEHCSVKYDEHYPYSASTTENVVSQGNGNTSTGLAVGMTDRVQSVVLADVHVNSTISVDLNAHITGGMVGTLSYAEASEYAGPDAVFNFKDSDITVDNADHNVRLSVTQTGDDNGSAGGFIGRASAGNITLENTSVNAANMNITSTTDASGGLIGRIGSSDALTKGAANKIRVTGAEVHASVLNISSLQTGDTGKAGGLIGMDNGGSKGNTNSSSSTMINNSVVKADNRLTITSDVANGNGAVGGILGSFRYHTSGSSLTIDNCHVIGGGDQDRVSGLWSAGGIAGTIEDGKIDISDSSSSTYVESGTGGSYQWGTGGLIGVIADTDEGSSIKNCYVGGRTVNGKYGMQTVYAPENDPNYANNRNRFNVIKRGNTDSAGGFIGVIRGSNKLTIDNCYTTASVYNDNNSGYVGSFIGSVNRTPVNITNSYSTGLVSNQQDITAVTSGNNQLSGHAFIGNTSGNTVTGNNNYFLNNVPGTIGTGTDAKDITQASLNSSDSGFTVKGSDGAEISDPSNDPSKATNHTARTYDPALKDTDPNTNEVRDKDYPYRTVNTYTSDDKETGHIGDWPTQSKETIVPEFPAGSTLWIGQNNYIHVRYGSNTNPYIYVTSDGSDPLTSNTRQASWGGFETANVTPGWHTYKIVAVNSDGTALSDVATVNYLFLQPIDDIQLNYNGWQNVPVGTTVNQFVSTVNITSSQKENIQPLNPDDVVVKDESGNILSGNDQITNDHTYTVSYTMTAKENYGFRYTSGVQVQGESLPQGQGDGTSFEKGCYITGEHDEKITLIAPIKVQDG